MTPIRFSIDDYSELFGLYLGDGSISASPRTYRLRVTLDAQYPRIVEEARLLVERTFPDNRVDVVARDEEGCCDVSVYHAHLPCLFPQHGAGPKFLRELSFELWQLAVVAASPWPFIRGCIRSDGCVFINRTGRYRYLSYSFANRSHRIAGLLALALQAAGIDDYRLTRDPRKGMSQLRVNRRASVALMRAHVGLKE